jgi:hypothetical protein
MHEWLEGLKKSAKRMASGASLEEIRRAETEDGVPFPEELSTLYRACNGGEFQGEVTLFPLHGPEGAPSVLEKTRLKLEGLPAAGLWRFGVKGAHRQLFTARASAMREQADGPLPGWMDSMGDEDWVYGTWETETSELRLYRSLNAMLEVLVPPAEVEEFGDRTYAMALSAVQGALSDLQEGEEEEETSEEETSEEQPEAGESEDDAALRKPVVDAARRRVEQLKKPAAPAKKAASKAVKKAVSKVKGAVKKAVAQAKKVAKKAPVKKAAALVKKAAAKKPSAKKAPVPAKKAPSKKVAAKKATKGPASKAASKSKGKARGRR